jgi:hypothetical protein
MLILVSAALFGFGLLLFSLGVAVWLAIRIAIRLFQLGLLIVWTSAAVYSRLRQRRKVTVLEGEILPPERRALPVNTPTPSSQKKYSERWFREAPLYVFAFSANASCSDCIGP